MFKFYCKSSLRSFLKDKQYSLLNLLGLSTGLACVLMIYLWVRDEQSVDKFNVKDNRIYQVMKTALNGDGTISTFPQTQGLLAGYMQHDLSEVEYASVVFADPEEVQGIISTNEKHIKAGAAFVDKNFMNIFTYPVIEGSDKNFTSNKAAVLIADKIALKLFNTTQHVSGKVISWFNGKVTTNYTVAGVFKSPPSNTTDKFELLFNYDGYAEKNSSDISNWASNNEFTYILLKQGTDVTAFNRKIKDFTKEKIKQFYPGNKDMLHWEGDLFLQGYSDRYLHNNYVNGKISGGRIEYIRLFSIIAAFILTIACINFMNLSTAKASRKMKEVGIKKVVGATRISLILQYMGESVLMAFASLAIGLLLTQILLPSFNEITGKNIPLHADLNLMLAAISIAAITGLIAGSYPALYLSRFKPIAILKGKFSSSTGESWMRKGLVVFQFTISVVLIVSVIVVYNQMQLIQNKNLGYSKENVISFVNEGGTKQNLTSFLSQLKNSPGVINASDADGDMFGSHSGGGAIDWPGKTGTIEFGGLYVDFDFMQTLGLQMKEGRMFSQKFSTDSDGVVFNETAISAMGLRDPVGKTISLFGAKKTIIGIVKDFNFESLHTKVSPFFLSYRSNTSNIVVKINNAMAHPTLASIEKLYHQFNPGLPFEYTFLDEQYNTLYAAEGRVSVLSRYFAGIAILISCLGIFGLSAFTAQKRQKEIGIRKVIGASVSSVVITLSRDFLILVSISFLIAIPLSWWLMNNWLQSFAYRTSISPTVFLIAGIAVLFITLFTISFQSIKAAIANPVQSLRTE